MVLRLEVLEGILRDHCALLEIVVKACERWDLDSPVSEEQVKVAAGNLEVVQSLLRAGIEEVKTPQKKD